MTAPGGPSASVSVWIAEEREAAGVEVHGLAVEEHVDDLGLQATFALEVLGRREVRRNGERAGRTGEDERAHRP